MVFIPEPVMNLVSDVWVLSRWWLPGASKSPVSLR